MTEQTAGKTEGERPPLRIDVWADIVCPWCYVGLSALTEAIAKEGLAQRVQVWPHAFELDPAAPSSSTADGSDLPTNQQYLERAHGVTEENFLAGEERLAEIARGLGKQYTAVRPTGNTRRFHRVVQTVAATVGPTAAAQFFETLQNGYFQGRLNPFDDEVLVRHGIRAGLSEEAARQVVEEPGSEIAARAENTVAHDIEAAHNIGIQGVPFMVFGEKFAAPGYQGVDAYRDVLRQIAGQG